MKQVRRETNYYKYLLLKSKGRSIEYIGEEYDYSPAVDTDNNDYNIHEPGIQTTLPNEPTITNNKVSFLELHRSRRERSKTII